MGVLQRQGQFNKGLDWGDLFLDSSKPEITMYQKWHGKFTKGKFAKKNWTDQDKSRFQVGCIRLIRQAWSQKAILQVTGTSEYARRFAHKDIVLKFRIGWVNADYHWLVNVTRTVDLDALSFSPKLIPLYDGPVFVEWNNKVLYINESNAFHPTFQSPLNHPEHMESDQPGMRTEFLQNVPGHEFGHMVKNMDNSQPAYPVTHGDEYRAINQYYADKASIMNLGNELRPRHFDAIVAELNTLQPDTKFAIKYIK